MCVCGLMIKNPKVFLKKLENYVNKNIWSHVLVIG